MHVLVETPSKFLITNDHLFWKESNMSLDDSTNILYMLKSPIIFSFLYPNAHVKLYFPVDHPWPQGLFVHLMICVSSEENSILLKSICWTSIPVLIHNNNYYYYKCTFDMYRLLSSVSLQCVFIVGVKNKSCFLQSSF